jgi:hypothetical protein
LRSTDGEHGGGDSGRDMPWADLEVLIAAYYPRAGSGRQPAELDITLRIYFP